MGQRNKWWAVGSTLLVCVWMCVVFAFSAQPDTESSQVSEHVSYELVSGVNEIFQLGQSQMQMESTALKIEFPVRKAAHMTEYAILAVLLFFMFSAYGIGQKDKNPIFKRCLYALLVSALYAATDEFHQLFVAGRAGRVTDVLIDSTGAFIALLMVGFIIKKKSNKK